MPGFITICPTQSHGGANNYSSAFLPAPYAGTPIGAVGIKARDAKIPYIANTETPREIQRMELDFVQQMNREQLAATGPDAAIDGRIESFELAFRMQSEAPGLQDITGESDATQKLDGLDNRVTEDFGRQCLMARRPSEHGVRFVQVSHTYKWDQHSDRPVAGPECARVAQGHAPHLGWRIRPHTHRAGLHGRDHNPEAFTYWLAGGVKAGLQYGATDDYGYYSVENKVHLHDLHSTVLHLLGMDHKRLTYRYAGRDFRLTDVHGEVIHGIVA